MRWKRLRQIVGTPLVAQLLRTVQGLGKSADRLLDPVHEVAIVGVRQVQLEHREFGVVLRREALVAEVAVDLVDALEAADHQALQVQLRRDAQVHVQVERVVVRLERARRGTARDRLHHRRLDLEEVERVQEVAQVADDARAGAEHAAALLVHDEIDVALAVARLGVGKAVPLVRQRPQRLHQQSHRLRAHRQLAGLGAEQHAGRADDVADVPALEGLVGGAQRLGLQEQLDLPGAVGDLGEAGLAHDALEHHAPADAHARRVRLQPLARRARRRHRAAARRARRAGSRWERRRPAGAARASLRAPLGDQLVLVLRWLTAAAAALDLSLSTRPP